MIKILDDFVPLTYQNRLKEVLLGNQTPWFYLDDVTDGQRKNQNQSYRPAFLHVIKKGPDVQTALYRPLYPMIKRACSLSERIMPQMDDGIEIRSILQLPLSENCHNGQPDKPHVDRSAPHFVVLYYVVDSEGDTIIYDKKT